MNPIDELKPLIANGSESCRCYKVEVCAAYEAAVDKFIFTKYWKPFTEFEMGRFGVPNEGACESHRHGYLSYHQAKALEHWLQAEMQYKVISLKTRLVEYQGEFTWKFTPTGKVTEPVDQRWPTLTRPAEGGSGKEKG